MHKIKGNYIEQWTQRIDEDDPAHAKNKMIERFFSERKGNYWGSTPPCAKTGILLDVISWKLEDTEQYPLYKKVSLFSIYVL